MWTSIEYCCCIFFRYVCAHDTFGALDKLEFSYWISLSYSLDLFRLQWPERDFFWYFSLKTSDSVYRRTILRLNGYRSVNEKVFNAVLTVGIFFNRNFLPNCILTCLENAWVEEEREEEQIYSNEFISDVSYLILAELRDNSLMVMVHMACANRWTVKRKEAIYYLLKIHEWTTILCAHDHWLLFFVER